MAHYVKDKLFKQCVFAQFNFIAFSIFELAQLVMVHRAEVHYISNV